MIAAGEPVQIPPNLEAVMVSDCHLRAPDDERTATFNSMLQTLKQQKPRTFVLLGDIFDFYVGNSSYFENKFAETNRLLEELTRIGTKIFFVEGNHEFDLNWNFIEVIKDHLQIAVCGKNIVFTHGDLVYSTPGYLKFRSFVKSRLVRNGVRLMPASWLDHYALTHARVSRSADTYRKLDDEELIKTMTAFARDRSADSIIFGHFHVPYDEEREGIRALSMDSWAKPSVLTLDESGFERLYL